MNAYNSHAGDVQAEGPLEISQQQDSSLEEKLLNPDSKMGRLFNAAGEAGDGFGDGLSYGFHFVVKDLFALIAYGMQSFKARASYLETRLQMAEAWKRGKAAELEEASARGTNMYGVPFQGGYVAGIITMAIGFDASLLFIYDAISGIVAR